MRSLRDIVDDYEWIHTWIGVAGNVLFVVGSVLFLSRRLQTIGTWMFISGSAFMLIGNVGSALVQLERDDRSTPDRSTRTRERVSTSTP